MQLHHALAIAVTSAALAACASRQTEVTSGTAATPATSAAAAGAMGGMTMTAQLASQGGSTVTGSATATHGSDANSFRVTTAISGAAANATHPWPVHAGPCGENGPVVGPASAYPPLQADANGAATVNTTVPVAMPTGPLYVNVHMSPSQMGTIVACGNLAM